ncbi:MAG TPA: hypothetical protein VHX64_16275, partial [Caulobacteraceae bacterium]|nr:hypothetical protein [Caulobacteraceae bacterium]
EQWPLGLLCAALGLAGMTLGIRLWRAPLFLRLNHVGFVLSGGLSHQSRQYAWRDIDHFFVWSPVSPGSLAAFRYLPGRAPQDGMARSGKRRGAEGVLPAGWSVSTRDLVECLNVYLGAAQTDA